MTDKTTKFLLGAIALGLFINAYAYLIRPASADQESYLAAIATDIHALANGGSKCRNMKICD
jgi:hypothetical protein